MRHRLMAIIAVCVTSLALAGAAFGHDCIRVSASLNGLQHSAGSGNWLLFDLSSGGAVKQTFADVFGAELTDAQANCMATAYGKAKLPLAFALGIGVAGPNGSGGQQQEHKRAQQQQGHRSSRRQPDPPRGLRGRGHVRRRHPRRGIGQALARRRGARWHECPGPLGASQVLPCSRTGFRAGMTALLHPKYRGTIGQNTLACASVQE